MRRQGRFARGDAKRKPSSGDPRPRFKIVCEGKVTEALYIEGLRKIYGANVLLLKQTGTPATIADAIIKEKNDDKPRKNQDSWAKSNQYWAVFDHDEHPYIRETIDRLKANNVGIAYSNPCFELWLILHFMDHDSPEHRHDIQRNYEKLDESYCKTSGKAADISKIIGGVEKAEERAHNLNVRRFNERNVGGNPSTTVGLLTRALREMK